MTSQLSKIKDIFILSQKFFLFYKNDKFYYSGQNCLFFEKYETVANGFVKDGENTQKMDLT